MAVGARRSRPLPGSLDDASGSACAATLPGRLPTSAGAGAFRRRLWVSGPAVVPGEHRRARRPDRRGPFHEAQDDTFFVMTPAGGERFFEIGITGNVGLFTFQSPVPDGPLQLQIAWPGGTETL